MVLERNMVNQLLYSIRDAMAEDLPKIIIMLDQSGLLSVDCEEHLANFVVVEYAGDMIGAGGLEICGSLGLMRSIVVVPQYRRQGIAAQIYEHIETKAQYLEITELYLLTESASEYFTRFGFVVKARTDIPQSITTTRQFSELCPASATVMCRAI